MKRLVAWALSLLLAVAPASAQMMATGIGGGGFGGGGAPAYTGPGDVAGTAAYLFCGTIAYTNASIGQNAIRVTRRGDNASQDFATQSNGKVDSAAVTAFITGGGDTRGTVVTCYDQTGNGRNLIATQTNAVEIIASGQGSAPVFRSPNSFGGNGFNSITGLTVNQPFTVTFAGKRTANFTAEQYAYGDVVTANLLGGWSNAVDTAFMHAGTKRTAADPQDNGTTSDYHAFAHVFNNAGTSRFYVGTTSNAISTPGSNTISSGMSFALMAATGQGGMVGDISYFALWAADLGPGGSGTASTINSNVCTTLSFSC